MPKLERSPEPYLYEAYGIYLLENKHKLIRQMKKQYQPSVHGHRPWHASYLVMDYLQHRPIPTRSRVIEVGSGWGPLSVFCASRFSGKVTALDIDKDVFPYLDVLAELNNVEVAKMVKSFKKLSTDELGEFDIVVGSDICFWDELVKPLAKLVDRAFDAGVKRVIFADPGRPTFYEMCDLCNGKHKVSLAEWYSVEPERFEGEVVEMRPA
ncbi:MAG: methyltransferase [Gammaproteobacteria bacterium]|nr:methyltransferase [Gammaproteobacteria bacterium]